MLTQIIEFSVKTSKSTELPEGIMFSEKSTNPEQVTLEELTLLILLSAMMMDI